jgi:hypothetical protein
MGRTNPFVRGSDASHLRIRERARIEFGPSEKRDGLFYLTSFDYSRNKKAKLIPYVKGLAIVEDRKENPIHWRHLRYKNTKIVKSDRASAFFRKPLPFLKVFRKRQKTKYARRKPL